MIRKSFVATHHPSTSEDSMVTNGDTKWIKMASTVPKISDPNLDEAHWHSLALPRCTTGLSVGVWGAAGFTKIGYSTGEISIVFTYGFV